MAINFDEKLNKIISLIENDGKKACKIIYVKGDFGVGKTELIYKALNSLFPNRNADVFFNFEHSSSIQYIYEFVANLLFAYKNPNDLDDTLNPTETLFYRNAFFDFLNKTYQIDERANFTAKNNNWLRSIPELLTDTDLKRVDYELKEDKSFSSFKKSELSLMFKSFELLTEAFLIDLLFKFYPNSEYTAPILPPAKPIKIVISLDDFDGYAGTVSYWLVNYLFKFCYKYNFFEFKNYDVNFFAKDKRISEYFDFRFIISGRDNFYRSSELDDFDIIEVFPFSPADVEAFLYKNNHKQVDDIKEIIKITKGNPYVLSLIAETISVGGLEGEDLLRVDQLATKKACRFLSEEQYDWLRCAAFIDEFDADALKYFPFIGAKAEYVFKFFSNAGDLCVKNDRNNKLNVNPNIKDFIVNTLTLESPTVAKELEKLADNYKHYSEFITYFEPKERVFIHKLAYFKRFDKIYSIQDLFGNDAATVRKVVENHPELFYEYPNYYIMNESAAEIILNLEKKSGREEYEEFNKRIIESWAKYSIDLLKNLESFEKQMKLENDEMLYSENKIVAINKEIEESALEISKADSKLSQLNAFADDYIKSSSGNTGYIYLGVGILLNIQFFFSKEPSGFKLALVLAGLFFLGFGGYKTFLKMKLKAKQPEFLLVSKEIHDLEGVRANLEHLQDIKIEEKRRLERKIKDLKLSTEQITKDSEIIKSKLEESFVREN